MVALIVLGILALIITLIMLVPIGADIAYMGGELSLSAKVAGILLQLLPKPPADERKPKKEKKPKKPKKEKPKKEKPPKPKKKLELNFSLDEILSLVKKVFRSLGRFGGRFNVDRFLLHYVAAGKDPYDTAMTYNYVNAALSSLAPLCQKRFDVRDTDVWTDIDFTAEKMKLDFGIAITIRIGAIFRMVFAIGFGALGILIKNKVRLFIEKLKNKKAPADAPAEADAAEQIQEEVKIENIQAEERTDSNGQQ